ncbi:Spy/CpxP family protein refolding chaperone [Halorhodospira neutriphila]|uniref:Signaling pathway modulator ZraP n=1 Tax=Halorhodospira neutriphila TaxID=168379 RepID=A0ABS1E8N1_9GAMM|nr:periplasmic heavy metal sensor [Halorhodospira neutriphila]MBK1727489.1 hypothetical protein [Halorhodospira neutriphila]
MSRARRAPRLRTQPILCTLLAAALALPGTAAAQRGQGAGPGGGMQGGMGPPGMMDGGWGGMGYYGPGGCPGGMDGGMGYGAGPMGSMWRLDLSEQQMAQLRELRREQYRMQAERGAELAGMRDEMRRMLTAERPDPQAVQELHNRMAEQRGEMLAEQVRLRNEVMELLDEEQRDQLMLRDSGE